jgi:serine phosphatase RsbU (regulator of sigma subunit)
MVSTTSRLAGTPVVKNAANKLRVYAGQPAKVAGPPANAPDCLAEVLQAFQLATGWSLRYEGGPEPTQTSELSWSAPVNPGVGASLGHLRLERVDLEPARFPRNAPIDVQSAQAMAAALGKLLGESLEARQALWQREAELAAGVPLVPHGAEEQHLAARLEAVLKGGAEAVRCQAAALYLLDEATTELKLRSCWGLPLGRLTAPARPLQGAVADLEALLGHAVVLENTDVLRHWNVPEDFPAAACVPVATPTTLLGTLWVYCTERHDFDPHQTNILEVVAGRLAADLEREMLLREAVEAAQWKRQLAAAERLQRNQLPTISPLLDGWELSGWTAQAQAVGGNFYDWFCLPNGLLAVTVGDAQGRGIEAGMAAAALKAAIRAHGLYHREAHQALKQINLTLWTGSAGDQYATLFYGLIETATGRVACATAGQPSVVLLRQDGWSSLSRPSPRLGESPEADYHPFDHHLQSGEVLVIFTAGLRDAPDRQGRPLGEAGVAEALVSKRHLSADRLTILAQDCFNARAAAPGNDDRTVLVVKRTTA